MAPRQKLMRTFGKVGYRLDDRTSLSLNTLIGFDDLEGTDSGPVATVEEPGTFGSHHTSQYLWMTLKRAWSPRLFSQTILSQGRLLYYRTG